MTIADVLSRAADLPSQVFDKMGRAIAVGDVLKVYHFQGARWRKHYFMYKQVVGETTLGKDGNRYFQMSHLNMKPFDAPKYGGYHLAIDGSVMSDVEIVQGLDDHHARPKCAATLARKEEQ